mgnify:FL=1
MIIPRLILFSLLLVQASLASDIEMINFDSMSASFVQTSYQKDIRNNISKGYLVVKRPHHMLWHIEEPTERVIIFERGLISIYDPDLNQVIKTNIDQYKDANWLRILMGESEINESHQQNIEDFYSYKLIKFQPLNNDPLGNMIIIKIKEELIDTIEIMQSENERIQIKLEDIEINMNINDGFFVDLIPDDAEVIE